MSMTAAGIRRTTVVIGFIVASGAPYFVRVVPNQVWRYAIPLYAFTIGILGIFIALEI